MGASAEPRPSKRRRQDSNPPATVIKNFPQRKRRAPEYYTDQPSQWAHKKPKPAVPVQAVRAGSVQLDPEPRNAQAKVSAAGRKQGSAKVPKQPARETSVEESEGGEPEGGRQGRSKPSQQPVAEMEEAEVLIPPVSGFKVQISPVQKPAEAQKARSALVEVDGEVTDSMGASVEEGEIVRGRPMPKKAQARGRAPAKVVRKLRPASGKVSAEGACGSKPGLVTQGSGAVVGEQQRGGQRSASVEGGKQQGRKLSKGASGVHPVPTEDRTVPVEKSAKRVPCKKGNLQV
jgi:hypothetical protein